MIDAMRGRSGRSRIRCIRVLEIKGMLQYEICSIERKTNSEPVNGMILFIVLSAI